MIVDKIINSDCLSGLRELPDESVNCCVTSPPYYGLRDYGHDEQIGLETSPEKFVGKLVCAFNEVKRVLKNDGTLWINIGDSYATDIKNRSLSGFQHSTLLGGKKNQIAARCQPNKITGSLKQKDLIGVPWMLAFALRASGWYLRQDIIWHKPNPMPESVKDRCTKSHEYIFLLSKHPQYYYDAESIKVNSERSSEKSYHKVDNVKYDAVPADRYKHQFNGRTWGNGDGKANKRSVWSVSTTPLADAHFATFPEDLIVDCIKAGCPEGGIVLDPFMGAGTTALVAKKLNRHYYGFELNSDYIKIAENRLSRELGLFKDY